MTLAQASFRYPGAGRLALSLVLVHLWHRQETAVDWDAGGAEQLPTRAEQQDVLLALLAAAEVGDGAVLDLGIGSGLAAERVLEALPDAQLVGVDFSAAMLDLARGRLSRFGKAWLFARS